jgi:anti-sigma-K factor RskA
VGVSEHRDEHLDLCAGYALGALDDGDRRRLEEHLAGGCPTCEAALADFSAATVKLAATAPPARPSAGLRERVLAAARAEAPRAGAERAADARRGVTPMPARRREWTTFAWAAAAAALAVVSGLQWNAAQRLRTELDGQRRKLAQAEQQLAIERRWAEVMAAPEARVTELAITPAGVQALKARAVYDPRTRAAVLTFENFAAPAGKDYQLWALRPDGVASLGLIKAGADGRATLRLENVGDPATLGGFAVSLEPAGGSPNPAAPTGPVVMAGKFGG